MYLQNVSITVCPFPMSLNDNTSYGTFPQSIVLLIKLLVETIFVHGQETQSISMKLHSPFFLVVYVDELHTWHFPTSTISCIKMEESNNI